MTQKSAVLIHVAAAAWNHARLLVVCLNNKDSFALRQSHGLGS